MPVNLSAPDPASLSPVAGVELGFAEAGIRKAGRRDLMLVRLAPGTRVAGVFTQNIDRAMRAWDELDVGTVLINEIPSFRVDNMPYGGVKDSGLGREGIRSAIEDMSETRLLVMKTPPRDAI